MGYNAAVLSDLSPAHPILSCLSTSAFCDIPPSPSHLDYLPPPPPFIFPITPSNILKASSIIQSRFYYLYLLDE